MNLKSHRTRERMRQDKAERRGRAVREVRDRAEAQAVQGKDAHDMVLP